MAGSAFLSSLGCVLDSGCACADHCSAVQSQGGCLSSSCLHQDPRLLSIRTARLMSTSSLPISQWQPLSSSQRHWTEAVLTCQMFCSLLLQYTPDLTGVQTSMTALCKGIADRNLHLCKVLQPGTMSPCL